MSIEPAETPEPRRTGHRGWDLLASFVAITISAASLYTAYHTSHSMERLVHASSWPALQLDSSNETAEGATALSFDIHNTGVGPAQIHDFKILVDGQPLSSQGWLIDNLSKAVATKLVQRLSRQQVAIGKPCWALIRLVPLRPDRWHRMNGSLLSVGRRRTAMPCYGDRSISLGRVAGYKCAPVIVRFSTNAGLRIRTSSLNSQCEVAISVLAI